MPRSMLLSPVPSSRAALGYEDAALAVLNADRDAKRIVAKSLRSYAEEVPEPGIGPLRWEDFPFQEAWYGRDVENAEDVVIVKSAQVGASAWSWRLGVRQADQFGDVCVYVFPTDEHVKNFGDERIERAIEASPYLISRIHPHYVRNKGLKRIGDGMLYLRGSNSRAGAQSIAAQCVIFDEYDLLDQTNLAHIERRTSGAVQIGKPKRFVRLGYPFMPNDGIDAAWRSSDQRVWHIACSSCGEEQPIRWEENFRWTMPGKRRVMRPGHDDFTDRKVIGRVWRCCHRCEATLEDSAPGRKDGALRRGRWIAQNPTSRIVGFHAWRGMVPVTDLEYLVLSSRATKDTDREAFNVLDLGRTFSTGSAKLTLEDLHAACALGLRRGLGAYRGTNAVTMGVDVAGERALNVRISEQLPADVPGLPNPRRALWIGTVETFEELARLIVAFRVAMCAVDANPERRADKALRSMFPGRVVLVDYNPNLLAEPMVVRYDDVGIILKATVNRTDAIDGMMDSIRQCRNWPLQTPPPGYLAQMQTLHRMMELDRKGRPVRRYEETGNEGADFAHAETYDLVATELWRAGIAASEQLVAGQGQVMQDQAFGFQRVRLRTEDFLRGGS